MPLREIVASWDGKDTQTLSTLYTQLESNEFPTQEIISYLSQPTLAIASSWLLKQHAEHKHHFTSAQTTAMFSFLTLNQHWQTQLHLLQTLPFVDLTHLDRVGFYAYIRYAISAENKFVKAWAYNGFYLLANLYPTYQDEALACLNLALETEPASVKARIRNCLAKGFGQH